MADKFFPDDRQDYVEIPREDGSSKGTNVFYRYAGGGASGNSGTFRVRMKNLKVTEQVLSGARGLSTFQLFMTFALGKKPNGAFDLQIADATVDALITVNPKSYFGTLEDFGALYDEYKASLDSGGAEPALAQFTDKYVKPKNEQISYDGKARGGHWSTDFTGIRAKTVRHELDHVKFAASECQSLCENFLDEVKRISKKSNHEQTPEARVDAVLAVFFGRFGFPYFDVGGADHKEIAKRDCYFMLAWYERYILGQFTALLSADKLRQATMDIVVEGALGRAMSQLGESHPWIT